MWVQIGPGCYANPDAVEGVAWHTVARCPVLHLHGGASLFAVDHRLPKEDADNHDLRQAKVAAVVALLA